MKCFVVGNSSYGKALFLFGKNKMIRLVESFREKF